MKKILFMSIAIMTIGYSCSDDNDNKSTPPTIADVGEYYPLAIGNYWTYDIYNVRYNNNGEAVVEETNKKDTITVIGTKIINGKKYFELKKTRNYLLMDSYTYTLSTDSTGYIINEDKMAIFSNINLTDTIHRSYQTTYPGGDTLVYYAGIMERVNKAFMSDAGIFEDILSFKQTTLILNRPVSDENIFTQNPRYLYTYYAKNVGIIFWTTGWAHSPGKIEYHLAKYCLDGVIYPK